jgi:hypothetical protein
MDMECLMGGGLKKAFVCCYVPIKEFRAEEPPSNYFELEQFQKFEKIKSAVVD